MHAMVHWWPLFVALLGRSRSHLGIKNVSGITNLNAGAPIILQQNSEEVDTIYCSSDSTTIAVVAINATTGELVDVRQVIENAPNPDELKAGGPGGVGTEWISMHPNRRICYALTSYWGTRPVVLVTYRIHDDGLLEKIGSSDIHGCYQACHASFSPDGCTYVVASLISGSVHVFDCDTEDALTSAVQIIKLPESEKGNRLPPSEIQLSYRGPMCHQAIYSPNAKYLIAVDVSQAQLLTYRTDEKGRVSTEKPAFAASIQTDIKPFGFLSWLLQKSLKGPRPRHVAIHPNGKFVYVTLELLNVLAWYGINENGEIGAKLGELHTLSPEFYSTLKPIGMAINSAAEVALDEHGKFLYVSNRGLGFLFGRNENSIVSYSVDEVTGSPTRKSQVLVTGNPRHFQLFPNHTLIAAGCDTHLLQKFTRTADGKLILLGVSNVKGMPSIGCFAH